MTHRVAYGLDEAARACGLSRRSLERLVSAGKLRTVRIGRRRLVPLAALVELLETPDPRTHDELKLGARRSRR